MIAEISSETSRMLRENSSIAVTQRRGSRIISTKSTPMPVADHADGARCRDRPAPRKRRGSTWSRTRPARSTVLATSDGMSPAASSERLPPPRMAMALAPTPGEQAHLQRLRQAFVGRRVEDQSGDLRRGKPVVQPGSAEIGHRRHIDQHLGHHDEQDREQQKSRRQAEMPEDAGGRDPGLTKSHRSFYPQRRIKPRARRSHGDCADIFTDSSEASPMTSE